MSFSVDGGVVLAALIVPGVLAVAVATMPRWFIRSMSKHALWRLRDDVVDDVLAGRLPSEHLAIRELVARLEWAIGESRSFDLLHLLVWSRARRRLPRKTVQEVVAIPDLTGLTPEQSTQVTAYRECYDRVAIRAILLSSWFGVTIVVWTGIQLLARALIDGNLAPAEPAPEHRLRRSFRVAVREATDEVASDTKIGQWAHEFVTIKGPALEARPATA